MRSLRILLPLLMVATWATPAVGQEDARTLPGGMIRLRVGALSEAYDSRFGSVGVSDESDRLPLSAPFEIVLADSTFTPVLTLEQELNTFFDAAETLGGPFDVTSANLSLSVSEFHARAETRAVPMALDIGLLSRVSIGVKVSAVSERLDVYRLGVSGGTVGLNPNPVHNDSIFRLVAGELGGELDLTALAASAFLPTQDSEVGLALQERVRAATGGLELALPAGRLESVGVAGLTSADSAVLVAGIYDPSLRRWEIGDTEISAKVQFLNTDRGYPFPPLGSGAAYRGAIEAGIRLATGAPPETDYLVLPPPMNGLGGTFAALYNDFFLSPRIWVTAAARWESLDALEFEQRFWSSEAGEFATRSVLWEPGTRLTFAVAPRARLVGPITFVGSYYHVRTDGASYTLGDVQLDAGSQGTVQQWSIGVEYSTVPAFLDGETGIPLEATLRFGETFAGDGGVPAARVLELRGSLYYPLWGGR